MLRHLASVLVSLVLALGAAHAQEGTGVSGDMTDRRASVDLLLDVIEDDAARAELIERLRGVDAVPPDAPGDVIVKTLSDGTAPPEDASFGRGIALITQQAAEDAVDWGMRFWGQLTRAPEVFGGLSGGEAGVLAEALRDMALVIAGTVVVFFALRWLGKSLYVGMSASARDGGVTRTAMLFMASAVIDALIVILAWGAGYALTILALGEFGQIGIRQTLYLNAFLLVEMAKVAVRLVLSPSATSLRPLPIGDRAASYLSSRINLIVGVVGYGQLLVVPIINSNVSFAAGRAVAALIAVAVLGFAIWLVLRNRQAVTDWLLGAPAPNLPVPPEGTLPKPDDKPATAPEPGRGGADLPGAALALADPGLSAGPVRDRDAAGRRCGNARCWRCCATPRRSRW
ncbi:moderate conductance mechanosensitive channel YbiO precursor [Roseovarius sp. A-2]|uniref:hypothetical protein n=1 Tax=Roseovarius sp. A-2 TaxID=1570360 RepID=UPI0009D034DE|nr:moderate conductance mechanosensitive channel YbiO precursor [Roseovarius sp. A-2]